MFSFFKRRSKQIFDLNQKQVLYGLVALVVVSLIVIEVNDAAVRQRVIQNEQIMQQAAQDAAAQAPANTNTAPQTGATKKSSGTTPQNIIEQYEDVRIIFHDTCASRFANYTFKSGTTVLLENQQPFQQIISLSGKSYTLKADSYALAKLEIVKAPKTVYVSCNAQGKAYYNIAKIVIQP